MSPTLITITSLWQGISSKCQSQRQQQQETSKKREYCDFQSHQRLWTFHCWYQWVCGCPLQSCITNRPCYLSGLPRFENTAGSQVSQQTRHSKHFLCLEVVWDAWLSPHDRWLRSFPGNWQPSSHVWSEKFQECLTPHQVLLPYGLPAAPSLHSTWSCCSYASCSFTLLVSLFMAWWQLYRSAGARDVTQLVCPLQSGLQLEQAVGH